jgi:hypothetical protein
MFDRQIIGVESSTNEYFNKYVTLERIELFL